MATLSFAKFAVVCFVPGAISRKMKSQITCFFYYMHFFPIKIKFAKLFNIASLFTKNPSFCFINIEL